MKVTLKDVYEYLHSNGYMYKGRTVTPRTIITMADNGDFETLTRCDCSKKSKLVNFDEVCKMVIDNGPQES